MRQAVGAFVLLVAACGSPAARRAPHSPASPDLAPITMSVGADCRWREECRTECMERYHVGACRQYGRHLQPSDPVGAMKMFEYACRHDDGKGCTLAGKMYDDEDTGIEQDNTIAVNRYHQGCTLRDGEACENLGWAYRLADGIDADESLAVEYHGRAARYYELGCDGGLADDCNGLGEMVRVGLTVEPDDARATGLFERACKGGSVAGCRSLALHGGGNGVERACSNVTPEACCELGHRYEHGRGVVTDLARAATMYETACESGSGRGCDLWGYLWEHGLGVAQDYPRAFELYQQSCGLKHVLGCYDVGRMYQHGLGVTQDDQRAVDIFGETCGDGSGPGCHSLAYMYQHGRGVSKNVKRALALYTKSCDGGEMEGCLGEAIILENGAGGIAVDVDMARRLVIHACDQDYAPACYHLGKWALIGDMVDKNIERATAMFAKGCELGHADSCDAKQDLDQVFLPAPTH